MMTGHVLAPTLRAHQDCRPWPSQVSPSTSTADDSSTGSDAGGPVLLAASDPVTSDAIAGWLAWEGAPAGKAALLTAALGLAPTPKPAAVTAGAPAQVIIQGAPGITPRQFAERMLGRSSRALACPDLGPRPLPITVEPGAGITACCAMRSSQATSVVWDGMEQHRSCAANGHR
jgi:hypothetical protein